MRQWMLRITAYAERLIDELDGLDWPEGIKLLQRNWIGRSEGAEIDLCDRPGGRIRVRSHSRLHHPAGHSLRRELHGARAGASAGRSTHDRGSATGGRRNIAKQVAAKSDLERTELAKEKTGVFIGAYAINPVNNEQIPIWIADYVLMGYGTGAIMAVPGHDERDLEFARKFEIPDPAGCSGAGENAEESIGFLEDGIAINSPHHRWAADTGSEKENHRVAARAGSRSPRRSLQTARLAFLAAALLGRAVPDRLATTAASSRCLKSSCRWSRRSWRITNQPERRTAAREGEGLDSLFRHSRRARPTPCRNGRAHAGITCAFAIRGTTSVSSAKKRSVLDGRTETRRRRSLRRRNRARRAASVVCALLAQGAL